MPYDSQSDEKQAPSVHATRRRDRQSRISRGPPMQQQLLSPSSPCSPSPLVASMTEISRPPANLDDVLNAMDLGGEELSPASMFQRKLTYLLQGLRFSDEDSLQMEYDLPHVDEAALDDAQEQAALDASEHEGMVMCQICLDEVALEETTQLTTCAHRFCLECFSRFLELKIIEGQVHPTCFHEEKRNGDVVVCGVAITTSDIQCLVSAETFAKLERFRFNHQHQHARQCPHCDASQLCEGPENPRCVCDQCKREFCFTHGNAHDSNISCQKYDKRQLRSERRNRRKIKRICKRCPACLSPVEKNGGCNHMKCLRCSTDFCWLCGEKLSDLISDHYDWTNIRGCAGQQMVHVHGLTTTNKFVRYLSKLTLYVVVYPIAFVFTLLAMICSGFFVCCIIKADVSFSQVFRWMFYVLAISGYTALEFAGVTLITGVAATLFGICWVFHELYKLGKSSVQQCGEWRKRTFRVPSRCCCAPARRHTKQPTLSQLEADNAFTCDYGRMYS